MASTYFSWISLKLEYLYKDQQENLQVCMDIRILKMFCKWLESCDFTTTAADEQANQISFSFTSLFTHLKTIWVQDEHLPQQTWPKHVQDFDPVTFGLEEKIQQSKPLIEQWCRIFVQCSSSMNCKSWTNIDIVQSFVDSVTTSACDLLDSSDNVPLFKNQIDVLTQKLVIMSNTLECVETCTNSKELVEYVNFVHVFFYDAACLVCMYWEKEANEETATEMDILLFDMLHKIKPFAAHVTASYFAVLKSNNLLASDDPNYGVTCAHCFQQSPVNFVDIFFEHNVLKDDFLILRERLIVLFTFLANAQEEEDEDVIRSQIYALFDEDSYLLLPINEMKEDLSNNKYKMLLSDVMNKIDMLIANIIQHYCRPSDSWNRWEAEKLNNIYFASIHRELSILKEEAEWSNPVGGKEAHPYITGIGFLRLFFRCFETWDDRDEETKVQLRSVVTSIQRIWGQEYDMILLSSRIYVIRKEDNIADLEHLLDIELKEKIQRSKEEINAWLLCLSHCSFHCKPSKSNEVLKFVEYILSNISDLVSSRPCKGICTSFLKLHPHSTIK